MQPSHRFTPDLHQRMIYQIRIKGHLSGDWADWFEEMVITEDNGDTFITGPVDQSALFGLLKKVRDLGTPLISVFPIMTDESKMSNNHP